ncbi:hypothetical protein COOONC_17834 [Cooperia oncophora]
MKFSRYQKEDTKGKCIFKDNGMECSCLEDLCNNPANIMDQVKSTESTSDGYMGGLLIVIIIVLGCILAGLVVVAIIIYVKHFKSSPKKKQKVKSTNKSKASAGSKK